MSEYAAKLEDGTVVLVEVVRCRDCESYQPGMYEHFTCEYLHQLAKPDDFCAWGERKQ